MVQFHWKRHCGATMWPVSVITFIIITIFFTLSWPEIRPQTGAICFIKYLCKHVRNEEKTNQNKHRWTEGLSGDNYYVAWLQSKMYVNKWKKIIRLLHYRFQAPLNTMWPWNSPRLPERLKDSNLQLQGFLNFYRFMVHSVQYGHITHPPKLDVTAGKQRVDFTADFVLI